MKVFLIVLFAATCQALSIESMIEKKAFEYLVNEVTSELEKVAQGDKEINAVEQKLIIDASEAKTALSYESIDQYSVADTVMKIIGQLHGKFHDLHGFFKKIVKTAGDRLQPHVENIKILAQYFIDHINSVGVKVARQALEFFKPFAYKLGDTWIHLLHKLHERIIKISDLGNEGLIY